MRRRGALGRRTASPDACPYARCTGGGCPRGSRKRCQHSLGCPWQILSLTDSPTSMIRVAVEPSLDPFLEGRPPRGPTPGDDAFKALHEAALPLVLSPDDGHDPLPFFRMAGRFIEFFGLFKMVVGYAVILGLL